MAQSGLAGPTGVEGTTGRVVGMLAVGFWSIYVCEYWIGIQTTPYPELWCWLNDYLFKLLALVAIGALLLAWRPSPKVASILDVASAACIEVGLALLTSMFGQGDPQSALVASTLAEVGFAWLVVRWGTYNVGVPLRQAFFAFLAGSLAVSLSKILLALLPSSLSDTLMLLVVPCSTYCLLRTSKISQRDGGVEGIRQVEGLGPKFVGIACAGTVFFLGWSFLNVTSKIAVGHYGYGTTSPFMVTLSQLIAIVFFVAAYCWSFVLKRDLDLEGLWRAAFLWLALAVAVSAVLDLAPLSQAFTSAAFEAGNFLLCFSITAYCHHTKLAVGSVVAFGNLPFVFSQWVIRALVGFDVISGMSTVATSLLFVALLATVVILIPGGSSDAELMASGLNGPVPSRLFDEDRDRPVLARLAAEHGLTDREVEVVRHICYGRTKQYIAQTMCLSENTIRTYSHRAYQKLGVHNRGELQNLVWGTEQGD